MAKDNQAGDKPQTTILAERACKVGGGVCAASIGSAQTQLQDWTWLFMASGTIGAAAFCAGGLFMIFDGHRAIRSSSKRKEVVRRGVQLAGITGVLAIVGYFVADNFEPLGRIFGRARPAVEASRPATNDPPESRANSVEAPSPPTSPSPPAQAQAQAQAQQPTSGTNTAALAPPASASTPVPAPVPAPAPAPAQASPPPSEIVSLYGTTPRALCGQADMSARRSSSLRPAPAGWILYSTDYFSGFKEQPLAFGEPVSIGNCTLVLEGIDPDLPRLDFRIVR
ncbi:MAG: hypothetical protein LCH93_07025 [Proteobacteria bacterium]|nr:hypothetical protein [Pseudomonadota bacterium]